VAQGPSATAFSKALAASKFDIFDDVLDLGHYKWTIGETSYKKLENLRGSDFVQRISLNANPPIVAPVSALNAKLPQSFASNNAPKHVNKFPYDHTYLPPLYVASAHRGVDLTKLDFVFGGSALHFLGERPRSQSDEKSYVAVLVPGTNTILVAKHHVFPVDPSAPGYQFEKFATGGRLGDKDAEPSIFEHMQTMEIGKKHRALICAELDAVDGNGNPVEIKCSNPAYWGTKLPLQLISSGSAAMYAGKKNYGTLRSVEHMSLSQVIERQCNKASVNKLQENICNALHDLKKFAKEGRLEHGTASCEIAFSTKGLRLDPLPKQIQLFPPPQIVANLLST